MRLSLSRETAPPPPQPAPPPRVDESSGSARLDVHGDFTSILELQDQLTHLAGVANVRVTHLSGQGATLVVELTPSAPQ
ncbi:MAG: hypothetical protein ABI305_00735 [Tepidiformaceae bacterium]